MRGLGFESEQVRVFLGQVGMPVEVEATHLVAARGVEQVWDRVIAADRFRDHQDDGHRERAIDDDPMPVGPPLRLFGHENDPGKIGGLAITTESTPSCDT
jgi:hypothetical protein